MLLRWGENCLYPLHHGLQDSPAAAQQTPNNNTTVDGKKWGGKKKKSETSKRDRKRYCKYKKWERNEKATEMQITCNRSHRQTWSVPHRPGCLLLLCPLQSPPWDHFHPLWVKRKPGWKWKVTQARAQALGVREEKIPAARALLLFKAPAIVWTPIQAYCCAEISRAPFGSLRLQRHAADPLVVLGSDTWSDRCVAPATITTGCGPLPFSPKAQYHSIFSSVVHVSRTLSGQHSYSFLSFFFFCTPTLLSPLVYMLIVLWSTLIIPMVIF